MDHQSNPTATRQVGATKKHCDPTELKASRKAPADTSSGGENVPLPEPPIRQVPVNVTRRTGPAVTVLPPPSNRQQNSGRPERRVTRRDQKRRVDGGEDSDNDSDRDESKRTHEADGGSGIPKKSSYEGHNDTESSTAAALAREHLNREELERMNRAHALRNQAHALRNRTDDLPSEPREALTAAETKRKLIQLREEYFDLPPLCRVVFHRQERLQVCLQGGLDIARRFSIRDWPSNASDHEVVNITMPEISDCLEKHIALNNDQFEPSERLPPHDMVLSALVSLWRDQVVPAVDRALEDTRALGNRTDLYRTVNGNNMLNSCWHADVMKTIAEVVKSARRKVTIDCHFDFIRNMIAAMANHFWDKVIHQMCEVAIVFPREEWLNKGLGLITFFQKEKHDERSRASFIQIVTSGVDSELLEDLCHIWHKRVILKLEGASDGQDLETDLQREFCVNSIRPQTVSLVTMKGDSIEKLEQLAESDLDSFGWFKSQEDHKLWRCELTADGGDIWKVSVDGEILGLFCRSRHDGHLVVAEMTVSSSTVRSLNVEEEYALGLMSWLEFERKRFVSDDWLE